MLNNQNSRQDILLFSGFSLLSLLSIAAALLFNLPFLMATPAALLAIGLAIIDFRKLYIVLFFFIPLSVHYTFPGGFSTDIPTEPLMVLMMGITMMYLILHPDSIPKRFWRHPLVGLILLHLIWSAILLLYSIDFIFSLKYLLAKLWYLASFLVMTALVFKRSEDFKVVFWAIFIPLITVTIITLIRHAALHFSFEDVNRTVTPYFKNHVTYSATLSLFLPFVWFARKWYRTGSWIRDFLSIGMLIMLTGVYFAYTRGAWVAVLILPLMYVLIRLRIMKWVGLATALMLAFIVFKFEKNNHYLIYAPDYQTTIYHHSLSGHLEATMKMKDVSSAERLYRWVAASRMFRDRPITGFGPGNFYPYYKRYILPSFSTYLSDNKEKSTVHNYLLLQLVEQGIPGFSLTFLLLLFTFIYGERIYFQTQDKLHREFVAALLLSLTAILIQTMLSDLIETDKIGSFFYACIAMLVLMDLNNRSRLESAA